MVAPGKLFLSVQLWLYVTEDTSEVLTGQAPDSRCRSSARLEQLSVLAF